MKNIAIREFIIESVFVSWILFCIAMIITLETAWSIMGVIIFAMSCIAVIYMMYRISWKELIEHINRDGGGVNQIRWLRK